MDSYSEEIRCVCHELKSEVHTTAQKVYTLGKDASRNAHKTANGILHVDTFRARVIK